MKHVIIIGTLALLSATGVQAQEQTKPDVTDQAWVALNTEKLNLQLGLDDAQQAKVEDIAEVYVKKHEALQDQTPKLSEKEMSDRTAVLMKERDRDMKAVLTAEQYTKWEAMRQKGTSDLTEKKKEELKH
ncbi:MAG: hypothetical protein JNM62_08535 [Flavobacteriales bacterium]|nr:hypothetical protein [Flavobacteriales bacterium]